MALCQEFGGQRPPYTFRSANDEVIHLLFCLRTSEGPFGLRPVFRPDTFCQPAFAYLCGLTPTHMDRPRKGRTGGRPQRGKAPEGAGFKLQRSAGTEKLRWPLRLNKYIAASGVCARRVAADLVKDGKVKVNGQTVVEPFVLVSETDVVEVNGRAVRPSENLVYILLNKPKNYLCTSADERGRHSVFELIREPGVERLFTVGRLDRNTTGLLLLTNDGEMAQRLSHPRNRVSKIYTVELNKPVTERDMQRIADGLMLEDGRAEVDALAWPDPSNRKEVILELHSGKNRIVRRIFESLGYEIYRLDRTGYAGLSKKDLPRGRYRHLADREVIMLRHFTGRVPNLDEAQDTGATERAEDRRPQGPSQRQERPVRDTRSARPAETSRPAREKPLAAERKRPEAHKPSPSKPAEAPRQNPAKPREEAKIEDKAMVKAEAKAEVKDTKTKTTGKAPDIKTDKPKAEVKDKVKATATAEKTRETKTEVETKAKTEGKTKTTGKTAEAKTEKAKTKVEAKVEAKVVVEKTETTEKTAKATVKKTAVEKEAKVRTAKAKPDVKATETKVEAKTESKTKGSKKAAEPKTEKAKTKVEAKIETKVEAKIETEKSKETKAKVKVEDKVKTKAKAETKTTKTGMTAVTKTEKTKAKAEAKDEVKPEKVKESKIKTKAEDKVETKAKAEGKTTKSKTKTAEEKPMKETRASKAGKASAKGKSDKVGN